MPRITDVELKVIFKNLERLIGEYVNKNYGYRQIDTARERANLRERLISRLLKKKRTRDTDEIQSVYDFIKERMPIVKEYIPALKEKERREELQSIIRRVIRTDKEEKETNPDERAIGEIGLGTIRGPPAKQNPLNVKGSRAIARKFLKGKYDNIPEMDTWRNFEKSSQRMSQNELYTPSEFRDSFKESLFAPERIRRNPLFDPSARLQKKLREAERRGEGAFGGEGSEESGEGGGEGGAGTPQ